MQEEAKPSDALSPEVQEIMRTLVSAIRAVKLYPSNNPVYSQSIKKSHEALSHFLAGAPDFVVGVQKTVFTYRRTSLGKDGQLNKAIAQDLFAKGIREIVFSSGIREDELLVLYQALALSTEELAMKSGITSILWEKGAEHIKVAEAGLDEVITTTEEGREEKTPVDKQEGAAVDESKKTGFPGRTLVLGDLMNDPAGFGASMIELAKQTKGEHESVEDRLYALYQEAGRKIKQEQPGESETLFEGLAKSVLALDSRYKEGFIAGKLYGQLDAEIADEKGMEGDQQLPTALQEVQAGRYADKCTVQQVATLLKKASEKKTVPSTPPSPELLEAVPIPADLSGIAKELTQYTAEEMAALKALGEAGMESDIIEAAVRTLIALLLLVKNPQRPGGPEKESSLFSGVVRQLEDMLSYILKKKDYVATTKIIQALRKPVAPEFKPRIAEALKKAASRTIVVAAIGDMRKRPKDSPEYQAIHTYLSSIERETTQALLELLADENDRSVRLSLLDLVKDFGKNQTALLGEYLSDGRWYFVRNIVNILGETGTDQAITFLRKAADHENVRIRQEVIKGLLAIGGKKAGAVLAKFLRDKDPDVQITAIRAFADFPGIGAEESVPLESFLEGRQLNKKDQELTVEAIKALGKIGGRSALDTLQGYTHVRWWRSRKLQKELKAAAVQAIAEIKRRNANGGRAGR